MRKARTGSAYTRRKCAPLSEEITGRLRRTLGGAVGRGLLRNRTTTAGCLVGDFTSVAPRTSDAVQPHKDRELPTKNALVEAGRRAGGKDLIRERTLSCNTNTNRNTLAQPRSRGWTRSEYCARPCDACACSDSCKGERMHCLGNRPFGMRRCVQSSAAKWVSTPSHSF